MSCPVCRDKGIVTVNWSDAEPDYALCLCGAGWDMRRTRNMRETGSALWMLWASREQIDPVRIVMLEDVLTPDELRERGFNLEPVAPLDAVAAAARAKSEPKIRL